MSLATIRAILEGEVATASSGVSTAYENAPFTPVAGVLYQQVTLLPAEPENSEIGPGYTDRGILQINIFAPKDKGAKDAQDRAIALRDHFPFAASFTSGGITVNIIKTPEIGVARPDDDRFMVPVRVRWHARISGG